MTREFAKTSAGYEVRSSHRDGFRNLQIVIHAGRWAMVSKNRSPAIHFVIRHPRLVAALAQFMPPVMKDKTK